MAKTLELAIPYGAQPQGSKKAYVIKGRPVMVESSPDLKKNRKQVSEYISIEATAQGWQKITRPHPVNVNALFLLRRPPSVSRETHTVAPDLDKLTRFLLDAITDAGKVFEDDAQVNSLTVRKAYGAPAIYLWVSNGE